MMNVSTSLVQAYLHVNGYFTATDYPLIEAVPESVPRAITDIDMLAVRLPNSAHSGHRVNTVKGPVSGETDPELHCPTDDIDMIVAEVKQGKAQVNPGARNRQALAAALARFGCCSTREAPNLVEALLQHGRAQADNGHILRMILFASRGDRAPRGWHWVRLDHVLQFLDTYLTTDGAVLGAVELHDHALGWLSLLQKCGFSLQQEKSIP